MLDLFVHRVLLTALFKQASKTTRGRGTHKFGVGAKGKLRVCAELPLPRHELWQRLYAKAATKRPR